MSRSAALRRSENKKRYVLKRLSQMKQTLLVLVPTMFLLAGCGSGGDEIVFDTTLGPDTDDQIKGLPTTLHGDTDNARYSMMRLKAKAWKARTAKAAKLDIISENWRRLRQHRHQFRALTASAEYQLIS